ncbi:MAG: YetF domain-containing protein [Phormidesmis sp.]
MAALFVVQYATARMRKTSDTFETLMQNKPVVLMRDGKILHKALAETRVAEGDLVAKLREANVLDFSEVRAVILETTGDISVLHGNKCSESLLQGTRYIDP